MDDRNLLLVDPDHDFLDWAAKHLEAPGIKILKCDNAANALKVTQKVDVQIIIADLNLQPFDGIDLLKQTRASNDDTIFIITAAFPSASQIIQATQQGAHDILKKESLTFELRPIVENAWQTIDLRKSAQHNIKPVTTNNTSNNTIIGKSKAFQDLFKIVGKVARTDAPILITGESGTGKEVVAKSIHNHSPRRQNELVAINCGAIPENLLESELFGHEKGSFTGASARRAGRFEQCDQSTLFLDEIGDMPLSVQVKLLRVLQEGTFSRVGGNETLSCDVRIIAATNKDLTEEVASGRFREDLYYRLNVVEISLPPLRERVEDIPLLAEYFLQQITKKNGMARIHLSLEAEEKLKLQKWPGNVRELENTITRACALADSNLLLPEDISLSRNIVNKKATIRAIDTLIASAPSENSEQSVLDWISSTVAEQTLLQHNGNLSQAANILNIKPSELEKLLSNN